MYSFSTCWNSHRHTDGRAMLEEIRELGFEYAELSHGVRISLLPGVLDAVKAGVIKISTLHNFCPLPIGYTHASPNIYKFSSKDARERENAYRHTLKTLETAEQVGATVVILHAGRIDMKEYTPRLIEFLGANGSDNPKYQKLCFEAIDSLERKKSEAEAHAIELIQRIADQAEIRGIKLGIENREAIEELPPDGEFINFLGQINHPAVGYWHDTGHAQIKENLGFIYHVMHLETLAEKLLGFHIHDVEFPARDHRPPGKGTIDFSVIKEFNKPELIKVFEFSPSVSSDDARNGIQYLKAIWGES